MKKRNVNLILFGIVMSFLITIPFVSEKFFVTNSNVPWQFSPFNSGDSLSVTYKERYHVLDQQALIHRIEDKTRVTVSIMIDGWGVPYDEEMLTEDFAIFAKNTIQIALHKRFHGYTSHAEAVELRAGFEDGLYITNGDSTECTQMEMQPPYGTKQVYCCLNCADSDVAVALDSILSDTTWKRLAWTAHETNLGDRNKLHNLHRQLTKIASHHPRVQFIIQGTHRPILGTPETRQKYNPHWVPAIFVNCKLKPKKN